MKYIVAMAACAGFVLFTGCMNKTSKSSPAPATDGAAFLLPAEPENARNVIAVRENAKEGDDILIVGRIGGSENPWIDGRAAFTIVDPSLKACNDNPDDECKTPWDYCCETPNLPKATALVKVVDATGQLVHTDARDLLGVKELTTVVVKGIAQRDKDGNLTVLASGVFVRK